MLRQYGRLQLNVIDRFVTLSGGGALCVCFSLHSTNFSRSPQHAQAQIEKDEIYTFMSNFTGYFNVKVENFQKFVR